MKILLFALDVQPRFDACNGEVFSSVKNACARLRRGADNSRS